MEDKLKTGDRLITNKRLVHILIEKGYGYRLTNTKPDKYCKKKCNIPSEDRCEGCKKYGFITHHGFNFNEEMVEIEREFYSKENNKRDGDSYEEDY